MITTDEDWINGPYEECIKQFLIKRADLLILEQQFKDAEKAYQNAWERLNEINTMLGPRIVKQGITVFSDVAVSANKNYQSNISVEPCKVIK